MLFHILREEPSREVKTDDSGQRVEAAHQKAGEHATRKRREGQLPRGTETPTHCNGKVGRIRGHRIRRSMDSVVRR